MKIHHVAILVIGFFAGFFILYSYVNQKTVSYNTTNQEYATMLSAACHDAAKTMKMDNTISTNSGIWELKEKRVETLTSFYESLARNMEINDTSMEYSIVETTPIVLLIDIDGFYIGYNACFDKYGNALVPESSDYINTLSNRNTWTGTYNGTIVRFYLSDYVEVTTKTNNFYSGLREDVYRDLVLAGEERNSISFLADAEQFEQERTHTVVIKIEDILNYYLNSQMINVAEYNTGYQVSLPTIKGEDWSRMLENPTIIAFMQGKQKYMKDYVLNIYAYAGGEMTNADIYFIKDGLYYRTKGNITKETKTTTKNGVSFTQVQYTFNGTPIDTFYTSMEECVRNGASPAPDNY